MLPIDKFKSLIENSNLFAIDFLIFNDSGEVLLGLRQNPPAKGYWFVPGGRVFKNETLNHAFSRILATETGIYEHNIKNVCIHGIYEHFHEDNFFNIPGVSTHYIILACRMEINGQGEISKDSQNKDLKFFSLPDLQTDPEVHQYTKDYFLNNSQNCFCPNKIQTSAGNITSGGKLPGKGLCK